MARSSGLSTEKEREKQSLKQKSNNLIGNTGYDTKKKSNGRWVLSSVTLQNK